MVHAVVDVQRPTPRAPVFDDVYFSADGGLAESRHVFIDGNDLTQRWVGWTAARPFVIGETGFGTGRNALVACRAFQAMAPPQARLHIVSIEGYPLTAAALHRIWQHHRELTGPAARLIAQWPHALRGIHRLQLADRVTLNLIFDAVEPALRSIDGTVDAWFLDGFAPARNPAMWQPAVFRALAAASRAGTTFATYSCARLVRDSATAAGFEWRKRPGAGSKRDMLCGRLAGADQQPSPRRRHQPWFMPPTHPPGTSVAIIGAGIAGTSLAHALAQRGWRPHVFDPHDGPGGPSAHAVAALHVRPATDGNMRTRLHMAALTHAQRWLARLDPARELWSDCGLLQLACDDKEKSRQQRCSRQLALPDSMMQYVDARTAARIANMPLANTVRGGLYFSTGGWVRPGALCRRLLAADGVTLHATAVTRLVRDGNHWLVHDTAGRCTAHDHVVLANAAAASSLWPELPPLAVVRGQMSRFDATAVAQTPACVLCGRGHVMPRLDGHVHAGASFRRDVPDPEPTVAEHDGNRDAVAAVAPALVASLGDATGADVGIRCSSHDRLPLVGPAPDCRAWQSDYGVLALDANRIPDRPGRCHPGLWLDLAHGAHGMITAPLAAEILASRLTDEPLPVPIDMADALHPGRWFVRELKRGHKLPPV